MFHRMPALPASSLSSGLTWHAMQGSAAALLREVDFFTPHNGRDEVDSAVPRPSVTEHRIEAARHANPLTFLPGTIPATEHITRLLRGKRSFVAAYADLNNFKPFNDQYGYFRGDKMIRLLADILTAQVDPSQDFVGHIGGDDFLVLFQSEDWEQRCERVIAQFNERAGALFDPQDLVRGGIDGEDRRGLAQFFPLTTIAIGAVRLKLPFPRRAETIATLAARAKRRAKRERLGLHVIANAESEPMQRAFV